MRITNKLNAYNSLKTTNSSMAQLYKNSTQLSTGKKIQNSYEGASTYITSARLEYEYATLEQVESAASLANELMSNTDKTLASMKDLLTQFKVKMTQAATATQTPTSLEVLAKDLKSIRTQIIDLANTSINGQFLFSGTLTNTKPFDYSGNYYGDSGSMQVVTGDGVRNTYNVSGYNLFYKADSDYKKQITTNVSFTDNRYDLINNPDKTSYLSTDSKISYLIGREYVASEKDKLDITTDFETQPLNYPSTALFVQGTKPDGTSFKSSVLMESGDTVQGLLNKIGALYGNTETNKVVEVSINNSGQIQITDLKQGNNELDFHAVAFTPQFESTSSLRVGLKDLEDDGVSANDFSSAVMQEFMTAANGDIGELSNAAAITYTTQNGNTYNISLHKTEFIFSKMTDSGGVAADGADYDNVYFEKKDNKIYGNVSQIINGTTTYATDSTKLSEVSSGDLSNTTLQLNITSKSGTNYEISIDLSTSMVSYNNAGATVSFPIAHTSKFDTTQGVLTTANNVTYRQLNDIIGLFATDRQPTNSINVVQGNLVESADYQALQEAIQTSRVEVEVNMDYKGRITLTDRLSTGTRVEIALKDSTSNDFGTGAITTTASVADGSKLKFSANNALIIDEPNVDLLNDLNLMIEAVEQGYVRADSTGSNPRNTGMQGALERLDHLNEHINKQRTIIGADQDAMSNTVSKVTLLKTNVATTQSEVIGVDTAELLTELIQNQVNYQAALKATTTLSQLSLLNYM